MMRTNTRTQLIYLIAGEFKQATNVDGFGAVGTTPAAAGAGTSFTHHLHFSARDVGVQLHWQPPSVKWNLVAK